MIKAVAFDFDHTLDQREKAYDNLAKAFFTYFTEYLRPGITCSEVLTAIKSADGKSFGRKRTTEEKNGSVDPGKHWMGIYNATLATGIFVKEPGYDVYYYDFIEKNFPQTLVLAPDTLPTLALLREQGYATGILTNGPSSFQRAKLEATGICGAVDAVVLCGDLERQKPHALPFETICRELGCRPEEAVYVGDNPINDMDGARKAGMIPIWISSVGVWPEEIPPVPYTIQAIGEIPELLKRIERDLG